jgi:formamidopyrimidine-DNA glycosylase
MPELPEVEGARVHLERWLSGRRITAFDVLDPKILVQDAGDGSALNASSPCVTRRAKYLILSAGSEAWILHFRMTGALRRDGPGRARWTLDDGSQVILEDPRRFAEIWRIPAAAVPAFFEARALGPEPWPLHRDGDWWAARLAGAHGPLKSALLDQSRVAGLGNIMAAELLWRARLSPLRRADDLAPTELDRLAAEAGPLLDEAVAATSREEVVYVNQGGDNPFSIYQQRRCPRCGGEIAHFPQAGRTTWCCPRCQPPPPPERTGGRTRPKLR